ncbi:MAG: hypothetical protein JNM82_10805, partial [Rhodocyclaceae bacterium]|nr:hypothetical protein [Rhodocyclaceae bacterium]
IAARPNTGIVLFWAPGPEDDPRHPGDDGKAAALRAALPAGLPVFPMPTAALRELIAGLALCDSVVCSDGGAMHLAAGLGKPIACLFGQSDAVRWHPWGIPHQVLQPASRNVADLGVEEVLAAWAAIAPP